MTVSFHKYGEYFPGTGELRDIGVGSGKHHAVNFPLRDGIDDRSYKGVFEPVIGWVMEFYKPSAVVLQCGGDSLSGDRLGCFNLSMRGHANCVNYVKSFNLPTLILGGGGYTMRNVARTWAYETGQLVGVEMGAELPFTDYYEYYSPDFELDVRPSNMDNANSPEYLEKIKTQVYDNLRRTQAAPSMQMQDVPRTAMGTNETLDEEEERLDDEDADREDAKDARYTQRTWDKAVERDDELSESDDEEMAEANGVRKQPGRDRARRVGILDYQNPDAPADESGANTPADDTRSLDGDAEAGDVTMNMNGEDELPPRAQDNVTVGDEAAQEDLAAMKSEGHSPVENNSAEQAAASSTTNPAPAADQDMAESSAAQPPTAPEPPTDTPAAAAPATTDLQAPSRSPAPPASKHTPALPTTAAPATAPAAAATEQPKAEDPDTEMTEAETSAKEREEGLMERSRADAEGEATTEMRGGAHNVGGGPAV